MPLLLLTSYPSLNEFLGRCDVIDTQHPSLHELVNQVGGESILDQSQRLFEWVRDNVDHSGDAQHAKVTCKASDVLIHRTGLCYAKSHLLCALLRIADIPAALCYQRLAIDASAQRYCLHGLCAMLLPDVGWYRVDPRGNRPGISAEFSPPQERLAFPIESPGEKDIEGLYPRPLASVAEALSRYDNCHELLENLPDVPADA